ncbi:MAG: hypothetical protein ACI91Q_001211 [Gammaproteobacteria bacterium]|jgi:hypothetical protein
MRVGNQLLHRDSHSGEFHLSVSAPTVPEDLLATGIFFERHVL